jgi:hypothetical protein
MRKQDRIAREQQDRSKQNPERTVQPDSRERERMRGGDSANQADTPPRQPGKLPLPD